MNEDNSFLEQVNKITDEKTMDEKIDSMTDEERMSLFSEVLGNMEDDDKTKLNIMAGLGGMKEAMIKEYHKEELQRKKTQKSRRKDKLIRKQKQKARKKNG